MKKTDTTTNRIAHDGLIDRVEADTVWVSILQQSSCVSCSVKGACNPSDSDTKQIAVRKPAGVFEAGQHVTVYYERSLGFKALLWGYIMPFVLVVAVLVGVQAATGHEGMAGLAGMASLLPYYGILYLMRDRIGRSFTFRIEASQAPAAHLQAMSLNS